MTDCIFAILVVIQEARHQLKSITNSFCDLGKAYDSICRELLHTKLSRIGFRGKVLLMICSMYFNNNVQLTLPTRLSAPTKGGKARLLTVSYAFQSLCVGLRRCTE